MFVLPKLGGRPSSCAEKDAELENANYAVVTPNLSSPTFQSEQKFDEVEVDDDEIYEKIEVPKYMDLIRPDQFLSDDHRSWFCLRADSESAPISTVDPSPTPQIAESATVDSVQDDDDVKFGFKRDEMYKGTGSV